MRKLVLIILAITISNQYLILPSFAVTAFWSNYRMVVEADEAIIPAEFSGQTPDAFEPSDTMDTAKPLKIGSKPQDRVIKAGDENWFILQADDGPGHIRIGATGFLIAEDYLDIPGRGFGPAGLHTEDGGPSKGADLLEITRKSITEDAIRVKAKQGFLRISTKSKTPVAYRISFVSDLPENRLGNCTYANYLMAILMGNKPELYRATRTQFTTEQATALKVGLFGDQIQTPKHLRIINLSDKTILSNNTNSYRVILSDEISPDEGRHWAIVITYVKIDGMWVVSNTTPDTNMSNEEIVDIVRHEFEKIEKTQHVKVGSGKPNKSRPSTEHQTTSEPTAR